MAKKDNGIRRVRNRKTGRPAVDKDGLAVWEVNVCCGFDRETGKYRYLWKRFHGSKTEAERFRRELETKKDNGINLISSKATFGEFSAQWLEARRTSGEYRESTIKKDTYDLATLNRSIGRLQLCEITPATIEAAYIRIREERGLSGTSMNQLHRCLSQVLKHAVDMDMIMRNPCDRVKAPKVEESPRRSLDPEEAARLLSCIEAEEHRAVGEARDVEARRKAWGRNEERGSLRRLADVACAHALHVILATGARRGEALALTWGDIDLEAGVVSIGKSLSPGCKVNPPKTKSGYRKVAIEPDTVRALSGWKALAAEELGIIGVGLCDRTPAFCNGLGGYIDPNNLSRWWRSFREENGFEGVSIHELRHTQATLLIADGADIKTVQHRLGHSNVSTTLNFYAHALPENDREAAEQMGRILQGGKQKREPRIIPFRSA